MSSYERECECDWTSGSFMLARREALLSAGCMDVAINHLIESGMEKIVSL